MARRYVIPVLEAFAPPYRSQLSDGRRRRWRWAELAGVAPSRGTLLNQEGCWVSRAIRRVDFPFDCGGWVGPAGFRVTPIVRRRLFRGASAGALAESHQPAGVAAVMAWGACSGQRFLSARRATPVSASCSGRFRPPAARGAG